MTPNAFSTAAAEIVSWITAYYENIEQYAPKSGMLPGTLLGQLPAAAPERGESFEQIFKDFEELVMPGITHWQHPSFFAYFPSNASFPSLLAEMLTAGLGAQCMNWETSPAAAEMEQRMMEWLRDSLGLPTYWHGVIQDTASTSSLIALLSARERCRREGNLAPADLARLRVYASEEAHSSIEKGVKIAGFAPDALVKIATDEAFQLRVEDLALAIARDREAGFLPAVVVATLGTTGCCARDPLPEIALLTQNEGIWLHVDAAYAGSAFILPELEAWRLGLEAADSFVFNPHKWMLTHFDCSAYFIADKGALLAALALSPAYLQTANDDIVNNYRDWSIALGRRFRSLKLWFVLRSYGRQGLQDYLRQHLHLARLMENWLMNRSDFQLLAPPMLNVLVFRYAPSMVRDEEELNRLNQKLHQTLNASGQLYLTHTLLRGRYALRIVIGQTAVSERHIQAAIALIQTTIDGLATHGV